MYSSTSGEQRVRPANLRQKSASRFAGLAVVGKHFRDSGGMRLRRGCEHLFNCTRDAGKRDTTFEESLYGHFVGCIQRNTVCPALFRSLKCQPQTGKTDEIGLFEVEMTQGSQVEGEGRSRPFRKG